MKVLLFAHFFRPENHAPVNRIVNLIESLNAAGHSVHVVAPKPNHPEGKIWPAYASGLFTQEADGANCVTYTWIYVSPKRNLVARLLNYCSFIPMAFLGALCHARRVDIVLATIPPPFLALAAWATARLRGVRFVLDIRDLWPALAIDVGELRGRKAIIIAQWIERFIYARADAISIVTEGFRAYVRERCRPNVPVLLVRNGTLPVFLDPPIDRETVRSRYQWGERFVLLYAGNIGVCQGLSHILECARIVQRDYPELLFVFLGDGPVRAGLQQRAASEGLSNVSFLEKVPLGEAASCVAAADAAIVPLANAEAASKFIPSKLFDSMASGRPVLLSVGGEAREILAAANAGIYYEPEDAASLADGIRNIVRNPDLARRMGASGREFAKTHCLRSVQSSKLVQMLFEFARPNSTSARSHLNSQA